MRRGGATARAAVRPPAPAVLAEPAVRNVLLLSATLAVIGALLAKYAIGFGTLDAPFSLPWPALFVAFVAADIFVIHVQLGEEAHSLSMSEIPFFAGLCFASPGTVIACRVAGGALALLLVRRQSALKIAFNIGLFVLDAGIGATVFRSLLGSALPIEPRGWLAAFSAALVISVVSGVSISLAIALHTGRFDREMLVESLPSGIVLGALTTGLALLLITILWVEARAGWLLAFVVGTVFFVQQGSETLRQRYASLELLYGFTRAVGRVEGVSSMVESVLKETRESLQCSFAEIILAERDGTTPDAVGVRARLAGAGLELSSDAIEESMGWLAGYLDGGGPALIGRDEVEPRLREYVAPHVVKDVMVAPLALDGDERLSGVMVAASRLGAVTAFDAEDLKLFAALANHANIALASGRLLDRLRVEAAEREHQALHDALTGLPNRLLLDERVNAAISAAGARDGHCALMLLDLDRFKEVNDSLGHGSGDLVLEQIGARLRDRLRHTDTVARLGGDEFAILLPDVADEAMAVHVARELLPGFDEPFRVRDLDLEVGASVGIALYPQHGMDSAQLLQHADIAMYTAKAAGTGVDVYSARGDDNSQQRLMLVAELRRAIENEDLILHFQPKIDLLTATPVGAEALVRWRHPTRGFVPPDEFIPIAERTALIGPLTWFVLRRSLDQVRQWRDAGLVLGVAVNLSARNLLDPQLAAVVQDEIERAGVSPGLLTLEITETMMMADTARTVAVLDQLAAIGVKISVDDFGTGYSSLAYLKRLPVHEIKVDKSFVINMAVDPNDAVIARSIIDLAHNLGMSVVAEGIEERPAWDALRALGCDAGQGYYMGRPMAPDDFTTWFDGWSLPAASSVAVA